MKQNCPACKNEMTLIKFQSHPIKETSILSWTCPLCGLAAETDVNMPVEQVREWSNAQDRETRKDNKFYNPFRVDSEKFRTHFKKPEFK